MPAALNGRIHRLEAATRPVHHEHACRACGLRHVRPLTLALLRGVLRVSGGAGVLAPHPGPLCRCEPCCGGSERWLARLSHGLPLDDEGTA